MQNLGTILATLYPNAVPLADYRVQQDHENVDPYIAHWDVTKLGPQPDAATLQAAEAGALRKAEALRKIAEAESRITPRRLREAIISGDKTWLTAQEAEIAKEREAMKLEKGA